MILYLCVLIVFSLHRESLKLILTMNPFTRWFCHKVDGEEEEEGAKQGGVQQQVNYKLVEF
jgi:hypothetical protein